MGCNSPGATHHLACDCREDAICKEVAGLRERLAASEKAREEADAYAGRANARIADLGERLDATEAVLRDAEKARKEAEERLTLKRREYDIEVEVHAATKRERDSYIKGYAAAESRASRLEAALERIAVSHTGCDDRPQPSARKRAELESDPWSGYQEPFCGACPRCIARTTLWEEGKWA